MTKYSIFENVSKGDATHVLMPSSTKPKFIIPLNSKCSKWQAIFLPSFNQKVKFWLDRLFYFGKARKYLRLSANFSGYFNRTFGNSGQNLSLYIGTPGPYSKNVAFFPIDENDCCIIKIASTESSKLLIEKEAIALHELEGKLDNIPEVNSVVRMDGYTMLNQSVVAASGFVSAKHLNEVISFVDVLFEKTTQKSSFCTSTMYFCIKSNLNQIEHKLDQRELKHYKSALALLENGLKGQLEFSRVHRDMAPWNLRITKGSIYAFDWEFSQPCFVPMYDIFHFLFMPSVLKNKLSTSFVESQLSRLECAQYKRYRHWMFLPKYQLLAYLLDICTFYLMSQDGSLGPNNIIENGYGKLIENIVCELNE
ncbi:phosphotransferase [Thalassotalea euphylliae]|uniref:Uncharacterized protein n=1 Tax=Thalassotalea euphylliae TaxID=1655234 RepID=A0A3E0UI48_9GAMM|nr:phosphotransferase [Thalassotalea euphylliae]REL36560.1 hypothetical protein DXX92_15245 [Thalassotalea euphylliae]